MTDPIANLIAAGYRATMWLDGKGLSDEGTAVLSDLRSALNAIAAAEHAAKPTSLLDLHGLGRDIAPHVEPAKRVKLPEWVRDALEDVQRHGSVRDLCHVVTALADAIESVEVRP